MFVHRYFLGSYIVLVYCMYHRECEFHNSKGRHRCVITLPWLYYLWAFHPAFALYLYRGPCFAFATYAST